MSPYVKRLLIGAFFLFIIMPQMFTHMVGNLGKINPNDPLSTFSNMMPSQNGDPVMTAARRQHIIYGDKSGGGHLHGLGKPCKSEFPADWDAGEIETFLLKTAANDNLKWKEQDNGYFVAEAEENGVVVRVVVDRVDNEIVTGYPVNLKRNPCPKPANDN